MTSSDIKSGDVGPISLASLLARRSACLDGKGRSLAAARARIELTRRVAESFDDFTAIRDCALRSGKYTPNHASAQQMTEILEAHGMIKRRGKRVEALSSDMRRYLTGGWLEEYAGLACLAAGADEARIGQIVRWQAARVAGVNEVDALARFGARLVFISCKVFRAQLERQDVHHRKRLMAALHEADNLADHFGDDASAVCLFVTTDLYDEETRTFRYTPLIGKAFALNVHVLTLDDLSWANMVANLRRLAPPSHDQSNS